MPQPRLILASASPRRQELLREAGYSCVVRPSHIDESIFPPELSPGEMAAYLAAQKARTIAVLYPNDVVLAADTVVALAGETFGKADSRDRAHVMLARLAGSVHSVLTGVAVVRSSAGFSHSQFVESSVQMRPLSTAEINAYLDTNNWQGKAGSYGIQDPDPFVTRITGSLSNIVGLPMEETRQMLAAAGIAPP